MLVVHLGNGLAQGLDAGGRGIFSARNGHVDMGRPLEAAFDIILDLGTWGKKVSMLACLVCSAPVHLANMEAIESYLGSTLTQVGPSLWLFEVAELACSLRAPDDTSRGPRGV